MMAITCRAGPGPVPADGRTKRIMGPWVKGKNKLKTPSPPSIKAPSMA
jgi:hypothetical protein